MTSTWSSLDCECPFHFPSFPWGSKLKVVVLGDILLATDLNVPLVDFMSPAWSSCLLVRKD